MRTTPLVLAILSLVATPAFAAETSTFKYDGLGRLVQSFRQGGAADGTLTSIAHDPADNRSSYTVSNTIKTLATGDKLYSADNRFYLTLQANGQLAVVQVSGTVTLWTSGTTTQTAANAKFQADGNLAITSPTSTILWASNTSGNPGARLTMQNDGNLTIKDVAAALWQTGTSVWAAASYNSDGSVAWNSPAGTISITSAGNYTGVAVTPTLAAGTYTITWTASSTIGDTGILPDPSGFTGQFTNNNATAKSATVTLANPGKISLFHRGQNTSITYSNISVTP